MYLGNNSLDESVYLSITSIEYVNYNYDDMYVFPKQTWENT